MARSGKVPVVGKRIRTSISIGITPLEGDVPFDITVTGILIDAKNRVVPNKTINLWVNDVNVGYTITDASGSYGFIYTIDDVGTFYIETEFPGDATHLGCMETGHIGEVPMAVPNYLPLIIGASALIIAVAFTQKKV